MQNSTSFKRINILSILQKIKIKTKLYQNSTFIYTLLEKSLENCV
jgi:hypothetical protein